MRTRTFRDSSFANAQDRLPAPQHDMFAGFSSLLLCVVLSLFLAPATATPQTFPAPDYFRQFVNAQPIPTQLAGPEGLRDYIAGGKLRLRVVDAIRLALLNNPDVHVSELQVEQARYNVLAAYQPFDPMLVSSFGTTRTLSPTTNTLQGAPTLSTLSQQAQSTYSQLLPTGTNYQIGFSSGKSDTNSSFFFLNPYIFSTLNFSITQPLLRNRGLFPHRAPIVIARRNLEQSRATFEAQVNNFISQVVGQYWMVVQAREELTVAHSSQDQAETTYQQDKRKLELGALPPLDIYRSESEVAQRRLATIQAEYALKLAEDQCRQVIGADLDPYVRALDLDFVENPEPHGELVTMDVKTAQEAAFQHRPELEALRQQLANDDTSIRLARNSLRPDLELGASYAAAGIGGNQFSSTTPPMLIPGGFWDSLSQVFGFSYPTYGATLTLNLPVRNRAAEAALGRASVAKRSDLYALRKQQQQIMLDVVNAVHQLEQAKLSMAAAKVARDLAQKSLQGEQRKYELGGQQIFFVLDAQRVLATAEVGLVQAEINYQLATTALDRATGALLQRHQVQIRELSR